jgi:serine/threonine-protein kinase
VAPESFAAGLVGIVLDGRYRLDALLGEGGMGAVFRAHHLAMDRKVAVKLLKPHLTNDDAALQRFAREARATMRVDSPHAVKILDFGVTPQRDYYMVLEYLDGRSVQREIDVDGSFEPRRVLRIARQALHALGAAHKSGIVHRDIKPENILLLRVGDDPDYTKLLDFGVAKLMEGAARSTRSQLAITQAGMVFGTPEYMSPEQACGLQLDGRSDLYSLAATMFAMLTGCAMYHAKSAIEWLTMHVTEPAPHLVAGKPALEPYRELDRVLQRCLSKRREDRPASAEEMAKLIADVEPTLTRAEGPGGATDLARASTLQPAYSAYIETLPPEIGAVSTGAALEMTRSRRGLWLAVGALIVLGLIGAAIVLATRERGSKSGGLSVGVGGGDSGSGSASGSPTLTLTPTPTPTPTPAQDGGIGDAAGDAPRPVIAVPPHANPDLARHITAAEEAGRNHKWLTELSEADAALQLDPHNVRATLLAAEAELGSGDLDHGCKYLHQLGRNAIARARAHQAGCPGD